jgi:hypothetical protein
VNGFEKGQRKNYHSARYRRLKQEAVDKMGGHCVGFPVGSCCEPNIDKLQFDHIVVIARERGEGGKRSGISTILAILRHPNPKSVWQCLCANCHALKTHCDPALRYRVRGGRCFALFVAQPEPEPEEEEEELEVSPQMGLFDG